MTINHLDKQPVVSQEQIDLTSPLVGLIKSIAQEVAKETVKEILDELKSCLNHDNKVTENRIMTVRELSAYSGLSRSWLYQNYKTIPHFYKKAEGKKKGRPYFKKSMFDNWFDRYSKEPQGENEVTKNIAERIDQDTHPEGNILKVRPFKRQNSG